MVFGYNKKNACDSTVIEKRPSARTWYINLRDNFYNRIWIPCEKNPTAHHYHIRGHGCPWCKREAARDQAQKKQMTSAGVQTSIGSNSTQSTKISGVRVTTSKSTLITSYKRRTVGIASASSPSTPKTSLADYSWFHEKRIAWLVLCVASCVYWSSLLKYLLVETLEYDITSWPHLELLLSYKYCIAYGVLTAYCFESQVRMKGGRDVPWVKVVSPAWIMPLFSVFGYLKTCSSKMAFVFPEVKEEDRISSFAFYHPLRICFIGLCVFLCGNKILQILNTWSFAHPKTFAIPPWVFNGFSYIVAFVIAEFLSRCIKGKDSKHSVLYVLFLGILSPYIVYLLIPWYFVLAIVRVLMFWVEEGSEDGVGCLTFMASVVLFVGLVAFVFRECIL